MSWRSFVGFGLGLSAGFGPVGSAIAQRDVDWGAVEIVVHQVTPGIYYLEGEGGNIGVSAGSDGIVMVDDQFAPLSDKILAAIRSISDQPIRFLINTHVHDDHVGGNEFFADRGATIMARDRVRVRMLEGIRGNAPSPVGALPILTFTGPVSLHLNGEDVDIIPVPPAHTDGDSYVHFRGSDVLHMGDVFRTNGYPGIDVPNGGSWQGTLDALQLALDIAGPNTRILSGHGVVSTRDDVRAFRDMAIEVARRVSRLIEQGMTLEQVTAARPTADLDERWGPRLDRFLPALYEGLGGRD